jgi:hypothetical protein
MQPPPNEDRYAAYPRAYALGEYGPAPGRARIESLITGWNLLKSDFGLWIGVSLTFILATLICAAPSVVFVLLRQASYRNLSDSYNPPFPDMIVSALLSCFVQFSLGILTAGTLGLALLRLRGQESSYADMFNFRGRFGSIVLLELILAPVALLAYFGGIFAVQLYGKGANLFMLPYVQASGQLLGAAVAAIVFGLCTFAELLVLDRGMTPGDALKTSIRAARPKLLGIIGLLFLASLGTMVGACACGIGVIFTLPFYYLVRAALFHDFFRPPEAPREPVYGIEPPIVS